jgi:hypothetical protein
MEGVEMLFRDGFAAHRSDQTFDFILKLAVVPRP